MGSSTRANAASDERRRVGIGRRAVGRACFPASNLMLASTSVFFAVEESERIAELIL